MDEAFEVELQAMQEVGNRRLRIRMLTFGVSWAVLFVVAFAAGFGIAIGAIGTAFLAGLIAVGIAKEMTPRIIQETATKYGISPDALHPRKFLVD